MSVFHVAEQAGGGGRLCDAGGTDGDVTHLVPALPSLIWTLSGRVGEQRGAEHITYVTVAELERKLLRKWLSTFPTLVCFVFFPPQNKKNNEEIFY